MKKPDEIKKWSAEDKLKALFETRSLAENDFGMYLRKEGLYSHQVTEWRADVLKSLDEARTRPQAAKRDERDDRIKELEHDLTRMEKALAEASARMMLQKKADLFWAERDLRMKK
jgi:transposase